MTATASPSSRLGSAHTVGLVAAIVTVLIWTGFIVIARASADPARGAPLSPFDILYARIWGAALVLLPWGWWMVRQQRRTQPLAGSLWGLSPLPLRQTLVTGALGGVLYGMLAYSGFVYAPAAHASVLMPGSLPLWTALVAWVLLGERIAHARAIGLVLIVGGDLLVGGPSLLHAFDGGDVWRGDTLFVVSSMVWACYSVLVRRYALQAVQATIAITVCAFVFYVPVYTLVAALQWADARIFSAPWGYTVFQMLTQGLGSVVVSGITFNLMIRHYGPVRSTMVTALVPGLSALAAALLLGEALAWNVVLGLLLVSSGIVFGVRRARANPGDKA